MEGLYKRWKKAPVKVRKPSVFLLGFAVVGLGIIDLPLPGPGWVIIFIGFAILGSEFEFAARLRDRMVGFLKHLVELSRNVWQSCKRGFNNWMQS
jgi:uncharacterized protein (TIGR02611 family)